MNTEGTHEGKLDLAARERRKKKNERNRSRKHPVGVVHGFDMPLPGANKRVRSRLYRRGNQDARR